MSIQTEIIEYKNVVLSNKFYTFILICLIIYYFLYDIVFDYLNINTLYNRIFSAIFMICVFSWVNSLIYYELEKREQKKLTGEF